MNVIWITIIKILDIMSKESSTTTLEDYTRSDYKYGFASNSDTELIPKGLNEDIVRLI